MTDESWRQRLKDEIKAAIESGRFSAAGLSKAAGQSRNYVSQFLSGEKMIDPGADVVFRLCEALGVSRTYITSGFEMTKTQEDLLKDFSALPAEEQKPILETVRALARRGGQS